jgi:hypothetical protein
MQTLHPQHFYICLDAIFGNTHYKMKLKNSDKNFRKQSNIVNLFGVFFFSFYFTVFTFTYIVYVTSPHPTLLPGRTCSTLLVSDFVEEKT